MLIGISVSPWLAGAIGGATPRFSASPTRASSSLFKMCSLLGSIGTRIDGESVSVTEEAGAGSGNVEVT